MNKSKIKIVIANSYERRNLMYKSKIMTVTISQSMESLIAILEQ